MKQREPTHYGGAGTIGGGGRGAPILFRKSNANKLGYLGCVYLGNFWLESGFSNVFQANLEVDKPQSLFQTSLDMGISKDAKRCVLYVTYSQNHVSKWSINAKLFCTSHTNRTAQVLCTSIRVKLTSGETRGHVSWQGLESWCIPFEPMLHPDTAECYPN